MYINNIILTNIMKTINFSILLLKMREARFWRSALRNKDKKFKFALKIGWRALAEGEPNLSFSNWRKGQDSNLRGFRHTISNRAP